MSGAERQRPHEHAPCGGAPAERRQRDQLAAQLTHGPGRRATGRSSRGSPTSRIVWELEAQCRRRSARRPEPLQPGRHHCSQEGSRRQLDHLRAACDSTGPLVSPPGSVSPIGHRSGPPSRHTVDGRPPDPRCNRRAVAPARRPRLISSRFRQLQSRRSGQPATRARAGTFGILSSTLTTPGGVHPTSRATCRRERPLERGDGSRASVRWSGGGVICSSSVRVDDSVIDSPGYCRDP